MLDTEITQQELIEHMSERGLLEYNLAVARVTIKNLNAEIERLNALNEKLLEKVGAE